jgi:hypothetical protein
MRRFGQMPRRHSALALCAMGFALAAPYAADQRMVNGSASTDTINLRDAVAGRGGDLLS